MRPRRLREEELRILHVWANLGFSSDNAIDLQVALQRSALERFPTIKYDHHPACSREQLLQRLNSFDPDILQISAHGDSEGQIVLAHPDLAEPSGLTKRELATLLRDRKKLRLLVLDCCYGLVGVEALVGAVDAVIGVRERVQEPYPIAFAIALYDSIANVRSLHAAVDDAVVAAAERHGGGDHASIFELWTAPGIDPKQIYFRATTTNEDGAPSSSLARLFQNKWGAAGLALGGIAALAFVASTIESPPPPPGASEVRTEAAPPAAVAASPDARRGNSPRAAIEPERPVAKARSRADTALPSGPITRSASEVFSYDQPPEPEGGYEPPQVSFEIAVKPSGQAGWMSLQDGASLSDLDDYVILIRTSSPGFLYVYQKGSSGSVEWLFPSNSLSPHSWGSNPVNPDPAIQIPEDGTLYLDQVPGTEQVVAAFSLTRWVELEEALGIDSRAHSEDQRNVGGTRPFWTTTSESTRPLRFFVNGEPQTLDSPLVHHSTLWFIRVSHSFQHVSRESWAAPLTPHTPTGGSKEQDHQARDR